MACSFSGSDIIKHNEFVMTISSNLQSERERERVSCVPPKLRCKISVRTYLLYFTVATKNLMKIIISHRRVKVKQFKCAQVNIFLQSITLTEQSQH
jgi:hypothetical protein